MYDRSPSGRIHRFRDTDRTLNDDRHGVARGRDLLREPGDRSSSPRARVREGRRSWRGRSSRCIRRRSRWARCRRSSSVAPRRGSRLASGFIATGQPDPRGASFDRVDGLGALLHGCGSRTLLGRRPGRARSAVRGSVARSRPLSPVRALCVGRPFGGVARGWRSRRSARSGRGTASISLSFLSAPRCTRCPGVPCGLALGTDARGRPTRLALPRGSASDARPVARRSDGHARQPCAGRVVGRVRDDAVVIGSLRGDGGRQDRRGVHCRSRMLPPSVRGGRSARCWRQRVSVWLLIGVDRRCSIWPSWSPRLLRVGAWPIMVDGSLARIRPGNRAGFTIAWNVREYTAVGATTAVGGYLLDVVSSPGDPARVRSLPARVRCAQRVHRAAHPHASGRAIRTRMTPH